MYLDERSERLTASNFGVVMKRRDTTRCHSLVKSILYGTSKSNPAMEHVASIVYGEKNEIVAIRLLEQKLKINVAPAGLFIDFENYFLAASPDGKPCPRSL